MENPSQVTDQGKDRRVRVGTREGYRSLALMLLFLCSGPLLETAKSLLPAVLANATVAVMPWIMTVVLALAMVSGISGVRHGRGGGLAAAWVTIVILFLWILATLLLHLL